MGTYCGCVYCVGRRHIIYRFVQFSIIWDSFLLLIMFFASGVECVKISAIHFQLALCTEHMHPGFRAHENIHQLRLWCSKWKKIKKIVNTKNWSVVHIATSHMVIKAISSGSRYTYSSNIGSQCVNTCTIIRPTFVLWNHINWIHLHRSVPFHSIPFARNSILICLHLYREWTKLIQTQCSNGGESSACMFHFFFASNLYKFYCYRDTVWNSATVMIHENNNIYRNQIAILFFSHSSLMDYADNNVEIETFRGKWMHEIVWICRTINIHVHFTVYVTQANENTQIYIDAA